QIFIWQNFSIVTSWAQRSCLPRSNAIHPPTKETLLKDQQAGIIAIRNSHTTIKSENKLPVSAKIFIPTVIQLCLSILQIRYSKHQTLPICVFLKVKKSACQAQYISAHVHTATEIIKIFQTQ